MPQGDEITIIPFVGFSPDLDPKAPGIWLDCDGLVGTTKGFKPEPGDVFLYYAIVTTYLLYDRSTPANIYAINFDSLISIVPSAGAATGGIALNDGWIFYIDGGVAKYDQTPYADVEAWDNSHTFTVDTVDPEHPLIYIP